MRVALILAAACTLAAAPPVITDFQPRGAQKGRPFTLTVAGRYLTDVLRVHSTMAATFTSMAPEKPPGMMQEGRYASFLVEPKADLAVGVYPVRVETADGISNVLLFAIGAFPEIAEDESQPGSLPNRNDSIETAQTLGSTPLTVNGTLRGAERDVYRIYAKAGEKRVFEVEARRVGSGIDPVIRVLDQSGKTLARREDTPLLGLDPRVEVAFPREGYYYVEVHDARFSAQAANSYRLKTGSYAYPRDLFPLGGQKGESVEVSLGAGQKVMADLKNVSAKAPSAFVNLPDSPTLPLPFDLGANPEVLEPATSPLRASVTVNGRLGKPGEVDKYTFAVKPGDDLIFEIRARELGTSKLMAVMRVEDEKGKELARAGDDALPDDFFSVSTSKTAGDPYTAVKVPAGVSNITVSIEDLALRGGVNYAYRLVARREANDYSLSLDIPYVNIPAGGSVAVPVTVRRKGYLGAVQLRVPNPPKGVIAEGGSIPALSPTVIQGNRNPSTKGVVLLTAEPGVRIEPAELTIEGVAKLADGTTVLRKAEGPAMQVAVAGATTQGVVDRQRALSAPWLGQELPAAGTRPLPVKLAIELTSTVRKDAGDEFRFRWKWSGQGVTFPETVTTNMVSAADVRAIEMKQDPKDPATGTFLITTTKLTLPARYDMYVSGRVMIDGQQEEVVSRPITVVVEEAKTNAPTTASGR
ncbi:MAG: hypothetical protein ACKV22_12230 [Bryobacteraceae bacterium]